MGRHHRRPQQASGGIVGTLTVTLVQSFNPQPSAVHAMTGLTTEGLITLWQLDTRDARRPGVLLHQRRATSTHEIVWGGQLYSPLPMDASGFELTTRGAFPQPTVTISNLYGAGNLLLDSYKGLVGAEIVRILTLRRFLDDGETPDPQRLHHARQVSWSRRRPATTPSPSPSSWRAAWTSRARSCRAGKSSATSAPTPIASFDPATGAFDYSLASCPYTGAANFDTANAPTDAAHDQCSRNLVGCQLRFPGQVLPARFFPGVGKVR